jgi:hypothetical protein
VQFFRCARRRAPFSDGGRERATLVAFQRVGDRCDALDEEVGLRYERGEIGIGRDVELAFQPDLL